MGLFDKKKNKRRIITVNGRHYVMNGHRWDGSLADERERNPPTAAQSAKSSKTTLGSIVSRIFRRGSYDSSVDQNLDTTSSSPSKWMDDFPTLSPGIAEFLATYDDNASTNQRDLTEPLSRHLDSTMPELKASNNFRDCDPQAILNNIDLWRITQNADPEANLTITENGVEIKVGDADFPGNLDIRVVINLNYLDLFTIQRICVSNGKSTVQGVLDNVHVSDLRFHAEEASMYKSNPSWG